jgi:hypothetical protein
MRMVVVVATVLEIPVNVNVPPGDGPPIYPTSVVFEHPEQERSLAPPPNVVPEASASGVVSLGPADHVPAAILRVQFTSLVKVAVVPDIVNGSQT